MSRYFLPEQLKLALKLCSELCAVLLADMFLDIRGLCQGVQVDQMFKLYTIKSSVCRRI